MFHDANTDVLRLLAADRHEALRRAAGDSRLRRAQRQQRRRRRAVRDG